MAINIDKIDKVDTNLITPSTEDNLVEFERDRWGIILNTALNVINKNNIIFKEIILELINNSNSINLSDIILKLKNLEIDVNSLEGIVDNNNLEYINIGLENRKLNLKGTQLEFNNNEINLDDIAFKSKNNTFKKAVNTEEHFSIEGEKIIDIENSNVNVGNPKNLINLISSEDIILLNGVEFKQKPIFSEVLEITNVNVSSGEIMNTNKVNFTNTYKEPPLVIINVITSSKDGNEYTYENSSYDWVGNITKTKFDFLCFRENYYSGVSPIVEKVYAYIISRDNVEITPMVLQ